MSDTRHKQAEQIIGIARRWLGTPYLHQASVCGHGADCLGLVRGVWRAVVGAEPNDLPAYTMDWGEISRRETMLEAAQKHFVQIAIVDAVAGDLVLFRWKNVTIVKHAGILTASDRFIHAYEKAGVVETTLGPQWRSRIAAAFRFPEAAE